MKHPSFELAERLETELGDPHDQGTLFSYARCADLDRQEAFPADICAQLDALGYPGFYVPHGHGGRLKWYEDLLIVIRTLARRDFTVALGHAKTYLGAACVWFAGAPEQARELASAVAGGSVVSLALTERDHGSDLLASEVSATPTSAGFRLDGEKWLINNATRGRFVCLLARTRPEGGPRGFSLMLVDKNALAPGTSNPLPAVPTHGVRGADISGIAFSGAEVPRNAMVGRPGAGLEITLNSLQVTRTLCAGMSLGMADHALRLAVDFAVRHRLYGRALVDLPHARRTLSAAYADMILTEALSVVATRSIHSLTAELSVTSAVVKYFVPTVTDRVIDELAKVLGARALLTEQHADGRFQKLERDHRVVGIFDGSTVVNLNVLINQFAGLARGYQRTRVDDPGLAAATGLAGQLPEIDPSLLTPLSRIGSSVVQSVPEAVRELRALGNVVPETILVQAERFEAHVNELHERLAGYRPVPREVPAFAFDLAWRYAACFAGAACLHLWLRNYMDAQDDPLWMDGRWLRACLSRVLGLLEPGSQAADGVDELVDTLLAQHRDGTLFSLFHCRLPGEGSDRG
jgi:alkylation response protein AidB-like acyl-CoA dehydrogenase